jgi:flagellar hook assembly protein FlgD
VKASGTVSFSVSAPGSVSVRILNAKGSLVRTLLSNVAKPAGAVSTGWDRTDSSGRRVKRGAYSARVDAVDGSGRSATASAAFSVY